MTLKMYLFTLVSRGGSMPGMGGQYAPEYPVNDYQRIEQIFSAFILLILNTLTI
jgi:hypothetical protein